VRVPAPPDGLRPGQLGVVLLRRVIIGDIAATLVDLADRELLTVEEEPDGADPGWRVSALLEGAPQFRLESLLPYEKTLLEGLAGCGPKASLASLAGPIPHVLDETRAALIHDAVHRGWLRHLHHDERTAAGEELAARIRAFQRDLQHVRSEGSPEDLAGSLLPYALHFGMVDPSQFPLARFAHAWVDSFADLPGWRPPAPQRPTFDEGGPALPSFDEPITDPGRTARAWITGPGA
jgi:hypothetical protein